jgi:hypothetical protein
MDEVKSIYWTKQNPEMNEHDKIFCDTLYRELRLKKQEELEGTTTEEINQEVHNG